jgi:DNA polymerase sigma
MLPVAESFLDVLDKIAKKQGLTLEVVGSFATGLWSSYSDIDVSLIPSTSEYLNFEVAL